MFLRITFAAILALFSGLFGPSHVWSQEPTVHIERGEFADHIDDTIENRIEADLKLAEPRWSVKILLHSSLGGHRLLELKQETLSVTTYITYLKSTEDAAKNIQYCLNIIEVPRYKPMESLGDEGYVMTESGTLLFRVRMIVVQIDSSDHSIKTQNAVAQRVISSVRSAHQIVGPEPR